MKLSRTQRETELLRNLVASDVNDWMMFAERNAIGSLAARAALEAFGDAAPSAPKWRARYEQTEAYVKVLMEELDRLAGRLEKDGIRVIALKNAGIARGIYPHPGSCPMGDIDVLVARDRLVEAHTLALELGFEHASRAPTVEPADLARGLESGGTEYRRKVGEHEVWLELQWRPIAGRWIPRGSEPDGTELISRSIPIPGTAARLLDPTDNMLQVALHTAKHSYCRAPGLRLHTDVDRLAKLSPPNWTALVLEARRLGLGTAVYFSLAIARILLDSAVPEETLRALCPAEWRTRVLSRWLQSADIFEPEEQKFGRLGMIAFHGLLYDDLGVLFAGTTRSSVGWKHLPKNIRTTARRLTDALLRYER